MPDNNVPSEERLTQTRSLYDASAYEIFWRNFLAGLSRALGGIVFYVIFVFIVGSLFVKYLSPLLMPILNQLNTVSGSLEKIPRLPSF